MQRFVIENPGKITVTLTVEVLYDVDQYGDAEYAAEEVQEIVQNAARDDKDEYMHFGKVTLVEING